ncbi:MAG: hypothetical protein ABS68_09120 [Niastella sp. SCN 39-18]|nr:DUF3347 domain-containing protein [Sphingobacteriales bacterium]ODT52262.1 MAG: hypothetical protein ABS68_09120 [Niastella sp. SCN 39-18]OJW10455.1 MAG: hypothetical protein BGO53_09765 [Sphingobacteriales bacterium 39-19]
MKTIAIALMMSSVVFTACDNGNNKSDENAETNKRSASETTPSSNPNAEATPIEGIVSGYLSLKNALANDNSKDAANAGNAIVEAMNKIDKSSLTEDRMKLYADVEEDAKEHAEHIGSNAGNIKHQREHFDMLSKDMYDLVKSFGTGQTLYHAFCPMYNDNKGAYWISETKEIKNPYFGKEMPTCGEVKEEIKQ